MTSGKVTIRLPHEAITFPIAAKLEKKIEDSCIPLA